MQVADLAAVTAASLREDMPPQADSELGGENMKHCCGSRLPGATKTLRLGRAHNAARSPAKCPGFFAQHSIEESLVGFNKILKIFTNQTRLSM